MRRVRRRTFVLLVRDNKADDEYLRDDIISGKRKRKLKNITIKVDPLQVKAIKKLATMKSIPYQTLIRSWFAEGIKSEMDSVLN
jgi:predicted DNA binding CopG/RHH family protein